MLDNYERLATDESADLRLRRAPLTTEERAALRDFWARSIRDRRTDSQPPNQAGDIGMLPGMLRDYGRHFLLPHPVTEHGAIQGLVEEISVDVSRLDGKLQLRYRLTGELGALRLPEPRLPSRTDGLWRHTCFEAFIGHAGADEYWEYNFSPSRAWASYHFARYREGMAPLMKGAPPEVLLHTGEDHLDLEAAVDFSWLVRSTAGLGLRLGLSAVIEDRARVLSYWSLKHPAEKPDFHHADGFVIDLD